MVGRDPSVTMPGVLQCKKKPVVAAESSEPHSRAWQSREGWEQGGSQGHCAQRHTSATDGPATAELLLKAPATACAGMLEPYCRFQWPSALRNREENAKMWNSKWHPW